LILPFPSDGVSFLALGGSTLTCTKDFDWVAPSFFRFGLQVDMWSYATSFSLFISLLLLSYVPCLSTLYNVVTPHH
jgi:hypothetical protein